MIQTGFWIGDRDWWIMASLNIKEKDLGDVYNALMASGCPDDEVRHACMVLSRKNNGYTFTDMEGQYTLMFASETTSAEEMFDTITHELRHATDHIGHYYGLDPRGEKSAYLQGEIARNLFPAVAMAVCPKCHKEE